MFNRSHADLTQSDKNIPTKETTRKEEEILLLSQVY